MREVYKSLHNLTAGHSAISFFAMADPARAHPSFHPGFFPTPPLSVEASREILEEMVLPPADTPERAATFERADAWQDQLDRLFSERRTDSSARK
jgi:hypothetical protein